jgi:hypothetical protein
MAPPDPALIERDLAKHVVPMGEGQFPAAFFLLVMIFLIT